MKGGTVPLEYDIKYFTQEAWGKRYEDDKYWDDEILFDNFIVFCVYAYAYLNLPRPSYNQLLIADFIANNTHNKSRMIMAMRGLA